jgi:glycosyltransferase involved in cell wall biosynthesis
VTPSTGASAENRSVSVVMPVRNGARYLPAALASIADQSLAPDEVIVIDDGSVDDSADIAAQVYPGARIIRQPPTGQAAAVNRGIESATGHVLAFLDADDVWSVDALECRMQRLCATEDLQIVVGATRNFRSPDVADADVAGVRIDDRAFHGEVLGAMVVRAQVFELVGLLAEGFTTGSVIDWVSRARSAGVRVDHLDQVVLHRRIHRSNLGRSSPDGRNAELLRIVRAHRSRFHAG